MSTRTNYDVIITTFLRPYKLKNCLKAVSRLSKPPNQVIIADQTDYPPKRLAEGLRNSISNRINELAKAYDQVYSEYEAILNLKVIKMNFDSGLAKSRKVALRESSANYVFVIDDDIYLPPNAPELLEVLEEFPKIGGIALLLRNKDRIVCKVGDIRSSWRHVSVRLDWKQKRIWRTSSGIRFMIFDYIPNCALFRRECLEDYAWDDFFKIGNEHADFYLTHKKLGKWVFAISLDHVAFHDHEKIECPIYLWFRWRHDLILEGLEYLVKKHGIKSFVVEDVFFSRKGNLRDKVYRLLMFRFVPRSLYWRLYKNKLLRYYISRKMGS